MKPHYINSYDKDKFVVGKEYWTFYTFPSNKGDNFGRYVKVFKTKLISNIDKRLVFDITGVKLSPTMAHNLPMYMNGYGISHCDFYDTEADAQLGHDLHILEFCKSYGIKGKKKAWLIKKMYDKTLMTVSKIEKDAVEWYESLTKAQQKHVLWLHENYTEF